MNAVQQRIVESVATVRIVHGLEGRGCFDSAVSDESARNSKQVTLELCRSIALRIYDIDSSTSTLSAPKQSDASGTSTLSERQSPAPNQSSGTSTPSERKSPKQSKDPVVVVIYSCAVRASNLSMLNGNNWLDDKVHPCVVW